MLRKSEPNGSSTDPFRVPEGYFDGLSERIASRQQARRRRSVRRSWSLTAMALLLLSGALWQWAMYKAPSERAEAFEPERAQKSVAATASPIDSLPEEALRAYLLEDEALSSYSLLAHAEETDWIAAEESLPPLPVEVYQDAVLQESDGALAW
jgi:cytoskeletal protein RodZ